MSIPLDSASGITLLLASPVPYSTISTIAAPSGQPVVAESIHKDAHLH